jgi:polysaccharide deacetylase 2 family uncharacterized protein YibQ
MSDGRHSRRDDHDEANARDRVQQRRAVRLEERRRRIRRNRGIAVAVAITIVVVAILVSPWGPLKGTLYSTRTATKKAEAKAEPAMPATTPAATTPITRTSTPASATGVAAAATTPGSTTPSGVGEPTSPLRPIIPRKKSVPKAPCIAIVVDDTGNVTDKLPLWTSIDAPLSFAVMPYPPLAQQLADQLYLNGYVIMMHIPTDNAPPNSFSGKGQLATGMSRSTVFATLDTDSTYVPHITGVNNHQGGRGCDQLDLMTYEVEWAKSKGLFVVDSNSSVSSKVTKACLALGLPKRLNEVFIDHENDPNYLRKAMNELAGIARKNGTAIGICHWHRPFTAPIIAEMVKTLRSQGINFAFASDITN